MKKILGLTIAALLVMALVGGGTWAYFSDVEQTTANIFTAGTLDLQLSDSSELVGSVSDLAPGTGETTPLLGDVTLTKAGSVTATLDIAFDTTVLNPENYDAATDEAELWDATFNPGGDTVTADGDTGELGANALIALFIDVDGGGVWTSGDIGLASDNSIYLFTDVAAISATSDASPSTLILTDSDHGAAVDSLIGMMLQLTVANEARLIVDNDDTTITVADPFSANIGTVAYTVETLKWDAIDNYEGKAWTNVYTGNMTGPDDFTILYRVPTSVGNDCQGDGVDFTIDFTLQQTP